METSTECQVSGCGISLPEAPYNTLHRICDTHAAMPEVVIDGEARRWCHPCARFEALMAFDGGATSCRTSRRKRSRIDPSDLQQDAVQEEKTPPAEKEDDEMREADEQGAAAGEDRARAPLQRTLSPACSSDDIAEFRNFVGEWMKEGGVPTRPPAAATAPSMPSGPLPDLGSLSELGSLELDFPDDHPPPAMGTPGAPSFDDSLFFDRIFGGNALTPGLKAVLEGRSPPALPSPPRSMDLSEVPSLPSLSGQPSLPMPLDDPWANAVGEAATAAAAAAPARTVPPPQEPIDPVPAPAELPAGSPAEPPPLQAPEEAPGDVCDDLLKLFDGSARQGPEGGATGGTGGGGGGCWTVFVPGPLVPLQQAPPSPPAPPPPPPQP